MRFLFSRGFRVLGLLRMSRLITAGNANDAKNCTNDANCSCDEQFASFVQFFASFASSAVKAVGCVITVMAITATVVSAQDGKVVYDKWCAGCHGDTGAGDGYGSKTMLPHPRDFTKGVYKIRTTASGEIPADDDLRHIIEVGMPGTAMPEWKSRLSASEITSVISYIKSFSPNSFKDKAKVIAIGSPPSGNGVDAGKAVFQKLECSKCHGLAGRADGKSAPTLKDDYGNPIRPADLTENWKFRGGNTVAQIYTRLKTGLDGTPMPSFQDAIDNKLITEEQLWRVAQYVHSLSPDKTPEPREVIRAARATAALPTTPDAAAWQNVERFWVPLVGQIIAKPRWFAPTVDGVWVQALHDGTTLAVRVAWDDPSKSPDPTWDEWLGRMSKTMTDVDGPLATQQGPDRLVVQFAQNPNEESKRPYFLGGDAKMPVYVWRWTSEPRVEEGTEAGIGKFTALPNARVTQSAKYADGQWQVEFTRPLASNDTTQVPRFGAGRTLPMGFFVADGSSGEDEVRGSVSTWYMIYLDVPTPKRVFVAPIAMIALSAGLGMLLVTRAQRTQNGKSAADSSHTEER